MKTQKPTQLTKVLAYILAAVLVLLPFHAFLSITLGTLTGQYELVRVWKELVLLLVSPLVALLAWKTPGLRDRLKTSWLFWCIAAYVLLHLLLGASALMKQQVNYYAFVYSLIVNLRFLLVFLLALTLASRWDWLHRHWRRLLLWPAAVVVAFGLLQAFALPTDFLSQFGYGRDTIMPYTTVDQKLDYVRVQSTLRGPNPLGAYLVLVLAAVVVLLLRKTRDEDRQMNSIVLLSAAFIVLILSYSRSAYIGAAIASLLAVWLVLHGRTARRRLAIGLVSLAVIGAGFAAVLRENDHFENVFFHTNEHSQSPMSSNEGRAAALQNGVRDALAEPFGRGPGTAGPASVHNLYPARISENYYLQIAQEVGLVGLGLFLAINAMVARSLWRRRDDVLARLLLASLAGIAFIGLVQHVWADDTLSLIWWAFAGVALASVAPGVKKKKLS